MKNANIYIFQLNVDCKLDTSQILVSMRYQNSTDGIIVYRVSASLMELYIWRFIMNRLIGYQYCITSQRAVQNWLLSNQSPQKWNFQILSFCPFSDAMFFNQSVWLEQFL